MNIPDAIFNENGVSRNAVEIIRYGDCNSSAIVTAAIINERVYCGLCINTPLQGSLSPVTKDSLDFKDYNEALSFFNKQMPKILQGYRKDHADIILNDMKNNKQMELF